MVIHNVTFVGTGEIIDFIAVIMYVIWVETLEVLRHYYVVIESETRFQGLDSFI